VVLSKNSTQTDGKNTVSFDLPKKPLQNGKKKEKFKIPDSEFDFATANAKFDKSSKEEDPTVYYQKSSFFDNISSEVKDRASANTDRKQRMTEEKSQNLETFGATGVRSGRGRGRGRGRSYRGRNQNTAHAHGS
jgi:protein LSM14